ncbi:putative 30S ribosomal protein 3, chloroplastic [Tetrabaena socialis]|uniref:30S ribosomal protein 3, chloroplastic n=1 Tax=Tetrabaena socialis TaxID=47790 RepID=A0A2J8AG47_9CHLO|nr:putative 30S ribosomal protein 3, chloroplastic [Tetrabaena socialis]|eukprot:PNH11498.1 putative 30S ribosomal protein 3, chloroplastic [Tetrabaena socialis]
MAFALLASRGQVVCLSQRHGARAASALRRPAPFTPARRVFARAEEAAGSPVTDVELAQLLEEEEEEEGEEQAGLVGFEELVGDDDEEQVILAAMEAAEFVENDVDAMTVAAVGAYMDEDEEDKQDAITAVEEMLASKLIGDDSITEEDLDAMASGVPEEGLDEIELEDYVPASNSDRYDEVPLSADDKAAIANFKLSKGELRALLPADWDQINIDFFSNKRDENIPLPEFRLNVLWTDKNLAVAIDQVYSRGQVSPLTEYYFWPRQDAWEELRMNLEARPWISERDRIILLNRLTQLINFWQDEEVKHSVDEARAEFPDCAFAVA